MLDNFESQISFIKIAYISIEYINLYKCLLVSGQPHEIHAATDTLPGIVLHVAEGHENIKTSVSAIPHTRLPEK